MRAILATAALAALVSVGTGISPAQSEDNAPGRIQFRGSTAIGPSAGEFRRWQIRRALIDEEHPSQSEVVAVVDLVSLDTGNATRDRHLRSEDFLGVDQFPIAEVRLHDFVLDDPTHFTAQVDLELHGHRRTFPMQFTVNQGTRRISGDVVLIRSDYEIGPQGWRLNPLRVGDEIAVHVDAIVPPATVSTKKDEHSGAQRPLAPACDPSQRQTFCDARE